jgi:hypothetical protein
MVVKRKMNKMQNVWCLFVFAFCLGCGRSKKEIVTLIPQDSIEMISIEWKEDSLGCSRRRTPEKIKQLIAQVALIGKDSSLVFKYLGNPNHRKYIGNNTTVWCYYMACGIKNGSGYNFYCRFKGGKMFSVQSFILE